LPSLLAREEPTRLSHQPAPDANFDRTHSRSLSITVEAFDGGLVDATNSKTWRSHESMNLKLRLLGIVALLMSLISQGQTRPTCSLHTCSDALSLAVSQGEVGRVEILHLPSNIETRAAITPQALEDIYETKLVIRNVAESALRVRMSEALRKTTIQPRDYIPDLRWGVIFYSRQDARIAAVYFDKSGRVGAVNDAAASFQGAFFDWLQSSTCLQ